MNQTLKHDLKTLAALPHDPGLPAFRALFTRRAGDQAAEVEHDLRNMILTLPETLERARVQGAGREVPREARGLHGYLLTYLYEPRDLIPETDNGLFGYVDDAYLATAACRRTAREADPQAEAWLKAAARVLPAETAQLDALLDGLLSGRMDAYRTALGY